MKNRGCLPLIQIKYSHRMPSSSQFIRKPDSGFLYATATLHPVSEKMGN